MSWTVLRKWAMMAALIIVATLSAFYYMYNREQAQEKIKPPVVLDPLFDENIKIENKEIF